MKILLLCDDQWHPGETVVRGLRFLCEAGHTVDTVMDAKDIVDEELLRTNDAVIIAKGNALTSGNYTAPWFEDGVTCIGPEEYRKYVEEGGSVLALHAGTTFQPDTCPGMTDFLGVRFVTHPRQCPVRFHVTDASHPIMAGVEDFTFPQDEHYQLEVLGGDLEAFAETSSAAGTFPAGLTRTMGKGKLCILTPGHNAFTLQCPGYRKVVLNALSWLGEKP